MTSGCQAPISEAALLDYWTRDLPDADAAHVEEHLFACDDCGARLDALAALGAGIDVLVRQGRVSGIISRALLNRMQRDGVNIRLYALSPGETVPCTAFPGDDLVVIALRADLAGVREVSIAVSGPGEVRLGDIVRAPVSTPATEVLWATPGTVVRQMPSTRLRVILAASGDAPETLGEYVLDHTASVPGM